MGVYDRMAAQERARQWLQDWPVGRWGWLRDYYGKGNSARAKVTGHLRYRGWPVLLLETDGSNRTLECPYGHRDCLIDDLREVDHD